MEGVSAKLDGIRAKAQGQAGPLAVAVRELAEAFQSILLRLEADDELSRRGGRRR